MFGDRNGVMTPQWKSKGVLGEVVQHRYHEFVTSARLRVWTGYINRYSFPRCSHALILQFSLFLGRIAMVLRTHVSTLAKVADVSRPAHPIRPLRHFRLRLFDAHMSSCYRRVRRQHYIFPVSSQRHKLPSIPFSVIRPKLPVQDSIGNLE